MTSETLFGIQKVRDFILADADIWSGIGIAPAYLDPESGFIQYRPDDSRNEYDAVEPSDKLGNWFYIRYQSRQSINFGEGEFSTPSMREQIQTVPLRFVGIFTAMEYHEVLDRVTNRIGYIGKFMQGQHFMTARAFQCAVTNGYIDCVGTMTDETDNRFISYSPNLLTIAVDFNLTFTKDLTKCRDFTNLNS